MDKVIKPVIPEHLLDANTVYHLNPSGVFIIGGPMVSWSYLLAPGVQYLPIYYTHPLLVCCPVYWLSVCLQGDGGLTGRKIIVDTYGGWGAHGGGAFSGKDSSKVDRSGAYAARWVAKSLVKAGLCRRCLVQVTLVMTLDYHPQS